MTLFSGWTWAKRVLVLAGFAGLALLFARAGERKLEVRTRLQRVGALIPKGDRPGGLDQPLALRTAPDGSILILSRDSERVRLQRFDAGLAFVAEAPARALAGLAEPVGMALDPAGKAWILDKEGRLRGLDAAWRAGKDQTGWVRMGQGFEAAAEGGFWALLQDGSALERFGADGIRQDSRTLVGVGATLAAKGFTVDSAGVPVVLLARGERLLLRRVPAEGAEADYALPYVHPAAWARVAALPERRIVVNDASGIGFQAVDLSARRTYRRAYDSNSGDFFRAISFIAADPLSGRVYIPYGNGLVAGLLQ